LLPRFHTHETIVSIKSPTHSVREIPFTIYQYCCNKTHSKKYLGLNYS